MRSSDWSSDVCSSDLRCSTRSSPSRSKVGRPLSSGAWTYSPGNGQYMNVAPKVIATATAPAIGRCSPLNSKENTGDAGQDTCDHEIGRASCRERVCQYG